MFSEVDAVLENPDGPSFTKAANTLRLVAAENGALVLCSGKTRAELQFIHQKLDIHEPFICENGGAVLIPDGYFSFDIANGRSIAGYQAVEFGRRYEDVVELLHRTADRQGITVVGFSDMSVEDVARECRCSLLLARLAKLREYDEPFRILDGGPSARTRLFKALHAASLRCTRGRRFDRVGAPVDSHVGVSLLSSFYRRHTAVTTVALAPMPPDSDLIRLVDHPIIVTENDAEGCHVDVIDWAHAIADTVQEIRQRNLGMNNRAIV